MYLYYRAAALGHFEAIQTLSAYGADFTLKTITGENAMHFATKNYRLLCTRLLGQRGVCGSGGRRWVGERARERERAHIICSNCMKVITTKSTIPSLFVFTCVGCPANETTTDEAALTPQKIAKTEGYKDVMKELKKLTTFQDKADRGAKPKGFSEPWAVKVSQLLH